MTHQHDDKADNKDAVTAEQLAQQTQEINPELVAEETGQPLADFTKQIKVQPLPDALKKQLVAAVGLLGELRTEIENKKVGALEKRDIIKAKIDALRASEKVNIDDAEFKKSEESVQHFVQLLDKMIQEVSADEKFYASLTQDNPPESMTAFKFDSDDFLQLVTSRIVSIKKYVKNAKRDLSISYSRYCFGFDAQIRQINYVEYVVNSVSNRTPKKA